ncbi:hypothetical protein D3OALGB2SA_1304 [Olavius algarvensis associated proteobacterium Delta 3]|nr:hypothetical protein D3OALGB2SA_1304 [Olavius algarvensis associated proteobacterium Delta 3]
MKRRRFPGSPYRIYSGFKGLSLAIGTILDGTPYRQISRRNG